MTKDIQKLISEISELMHRQADEYVSLLQLAFEYQDSENKEEETQKRLTTISAYFKGRKPLEITLPNGESIQVKKWKNVFETILKDCNSNPQNHDTLMSMRNKVYGRDRIIVSDTSEQMDAPIKVDDELFVESKFDTETLFNVLKQRILPALDYDESKVLIKSHKPIPQYILEREIKMQKPNATELSNDDEISDVFEEDDEEIGMTM